MINRLLEKFNLRSPPNTTDVTDANEKYEDCLSCKLVGVGSFGGLSAYTLYQRSQIPKIKVFHRGVVAGFALLFAGVAVTRAAI